MPVATTNDDPPSSLDDAKVRLKLPVYDRLIEPYGLATAPQQARWHGIDRAHMYRLRNGQREPGLKIAMKIARDLGVPVEALFEWVDDAPRRAA